MNPILIQVIATIVILLVIMTMVFFMKRVTDISMDGHILTVKYPLSTKQINLDEELVSWKEQQIHYLWWGRFYAVSMQFKNESQISVGSFMNQQNYQLLNQYLRGRFENMKEKTVYATN